MEFTKEYYQKSYLREIASHKKWLKENDTYAKWFKSGVEMMKRVREYDEGVNKSIEEENKKEDLKKELEKEKDFVNW